MRDAECGVNPDGVGMRPGDWEARQACFANVREEWVDQADHMLHHDQPAEVARIVEAFIG